MTERSAIVVGAGIVGVCSAIYLQRAGFKVTLIERARPGEACSYGNAGNIGLSSFTPYSLPDTWKRVPKLLANPKAALKVRPNQFLKSLPWFWKFIRAGRAERVKEIMAARRAILPRALDAYEPILREANARPLIETKGKLLLFESDAAFQSAQYDLNNRREGGGKVDILAAEEVRQLQPGLSPKIVKGAYLPDLAHCVNPLKLTQALFQHFMARGGDFLGATVRALEPRHGAAPIVVTDYGPREADWVVLAAGVWSKDLARPLGLRLPIEAQGGYHAMMVQPQTEIRVPLMSPARNIIVSPMAEGLRVTGIAEHAGVDPTPDYKHVDLILEHARALVPGLGAKPVTRWAGQRPSTPDSLPIIGRVPGHPHVLLACGHGHTGLTMGAITGQIVAEIAADQPTVIDPTPYNVARFG